MPASGRQRQSWPDSCPRRRAAAYERLRPYGFFIVIALMYAGRPDLRLRTRPESHSPALIFSKHVRRIPPRPCPLEDAPVPAPAAEAVPDGYQVRLDVFEGPLDLLLFLIRKKKIDIHDIPIAAITRDYLDYLERKTEINLDREAEFLFIAALLIYIKSQMLLPRETDLAEHEDPRRVLIDRLVEYEKVKAACSLLREREDVQILQWKRDFIPPLAGESELEPVELSLFDLAESFFLMMKRRAADDTRVIRGRDVSIEVKMKELVSLLHERQMIDFLPYFEAHASLEEALVSFFCILELVKSRVAVAVQDELFQTIRVWLRKDARRTGTHE